MALTLEASLGGRFAETIEPEATNADLVCWLKCHEVEGNTCADSSSSGNDGTIAPVEPDWFDPAVGVQHSGRVWRVPGGTPMDGGGALNFTAAQTLSRAITISDDASLAFGSAAFAIELVLQIASWGVPSARRLIEKGDSGAHWFLEYDSTADTLTFSLGDGTNTSTAVWSSVVIPVRSTDASAWMHLVVNRINTTTVELFVDGVSQGTKTLSPAIGSVSNSTAITIGRNVGTGTYTPIAISDVLLWTAVVTSGDALSRANATAYTDISADLANVPVHIRRGFADQSVQHRVASPGSATFALRNAATNSGGLLGYYSPLHANVRSGWQIGVMIRIRDGTTVFTGRVEQISPVAGAVGAPIVQVVATDWLATASDATVTGLATQRTVRSDALTGTVIASTESPPNGGSFDVGIETFPVALQDLRDERTTIRRALAGIAISEYGYLYVDGKGRLIGENRTYRQRFYGNPSGNTSENDMQGLTMAHRRHTIANRVTVVIHPARVDSAATTIVWELSNTETVPVVPAGQTLTLSGLLRDATGQFVRIAAESGVTPVEGVDYVGNSADDGTGVSLSANLSVVATFSSNAVQFAITNSGTIDAYLVTLQARAKGVYDQHELLIEEADAPSRRDYGDRTARIDQPYASQVTGAIALAKRVLRERKDPTALNTTVRYVSTLTTKPQFGTLEIGDQVSITEDVVGFEASPDADEPDTFYVHTIDAVYTQPDLMDVTYTLIPNSGLGYGWILGSTFYSDLNEQTYLGYGGGWSPGPR